MIKSFRDVFLGNAEIEPPVSDVHPDFDKSDDAGRYDSNAVYYTLVPAEVRRDPRYHAVDLLAMRLISADLLKKEYSLPAEGIIDTARAREAVTAAYQELGHKIMWEGTPPHLPYPIPDSFFAMTITPEPSSGIPAFDAVVTRPSRIYK